MRTEYGKGARQIKILLVEDHIDTLNAFAQFLRLNGHIVYAADGYQAAMDAARRERFDLAICDISLWDGDGCALIKDLKQLQDITAIAVTGFALDDEVEIYREAGFASVFQKPFDPSQVVSAINGLAASSHRPEGLS